MLYVYPSDLTLDTT